MGEYWYLLNQTAHFNGGNHIYGKWGEFFFNPEAAKELIAYFRNWRNPFPDLNAVLLSIEEARAKQANENTSQETAQTAATDTRCRLLELPEDILRIIFIQNRGYADLLSLSATCMTMLKLLGAKTAEVRKNFGEAMGPPAYGDGSWSGQRIVIMGENHDWTQYKAFVKKTIKTAYERRGITDLDRETLQTIEDIDDILPRGDVYDTENLVNGEETLIASGVTYHEITPGRIARGHVLKDMLDESHFDFVQARFIQPDAFVALQRFRRENPKPDQMYYPDLLDYYEAEDDWEKKDSVFKDPWYEFRNRREHLTDIIGLTLESRRFRKAINSHGNPYRLLERASLERSTAEYCIVNLDTKECMRSAAIRKHRHIEQVGRAPFTAAFVLMSHIMFSYDGTVEADQDLIYGGRWAGHRLHMIPLLDTNDDGISEEDRALLAGTTDISLELLDKTQRFCLAHKPDWTYVMVPGFEKEAELNAGKDSQDEGAHADEQDQGDSGDEDDEEDDADEEEAGEGTGATGEANAQPEESEAKPLRRSDRIENMSAS